MTVKIARNPSDKPLLGAVLCCTSIPPEIRTQLAEYAEAMGAEHKLDLTSDVTHLLVGASSSEKYRYVAKEREDVKVLRPEWVEAVRQQWMKDDTIDMHALERDFRLPTLFGLTICITGFEDANFRDGLERNVKENGGQYQPHLDRHVTHLIAAEPVGKKYEFATGCNTMKVVGLKWYKDTLARGMQLNEDLYHPTKPPQEQGLGARRVRTVASESFRKRKADEANPPEANRKIRRTASTKFGSQSQEIWQHITTAGLSDPTAPLRSAQSMPDMLKNASTGLDQDKVTADHAAKAGFLANLHFAMAGFDTKKEALLRDTLSLLGATVYDSLHQLSRAGTIDTRNRYLIIYHATDQSPLLARHPFLHDIHVLTEFWLEWCMVKKAWVPPETYALSRPIRKISRPEISKTVINATGFHGITTLHISKAVPHLGASYSELFNKDVSVLVCNSANVNHDKVMFAAHLKIPIVSEKWLAHLMTSGQLPSFEPYLLVATQQKVRNQADQVSNSLNQGADVSENTVQPNSRLVQSSEKSSAPTSGGRELSIQKDQPLQELSGNIPSRRSSPKEVGKKALFRTTTSTVTAAAQVLDNTARPGGANEENTVSNLDGVVSQHSVPVQELLELKAALGAKSAEETRSLTKPVQRRLFGRATSNLSDSSHVSNDVRTLTRVDSINSVNTDGLGTELSNMSRLQRVSSMPNGSGTALLKGNPDRVQRVPSEAVAAAAAATSSVSHDNPFHTLSTSQPDPILPPEPTQIGYEPTAESKALMEKLARKRRERQRREQHSDEAAIALSREESEKRRHEEAVRTEQEQRAAVIRDDEALIGVGRRTRNRDRVLRQSMGDLAEPEQAGY